MEIQGLFQNKRFARSIIAAGILTGLFLISNIFVAGGDEFFTFSNTLLSPAAALVAGLLFFQASLNRKDTPAHNFWLGMAAGFGLWGLADIIWAYFTLVFDFEIAYPSIADGIWIIGYIPLYFALITRLRSLKITPTLRQSLLITGINLTWILFTLGFVLLPIVRDFDPSLLSEGIVNLIYPLADVGLLVLANLILILLKEGRFSLVWRMIFSGIFLMTFSDLLFSYGAWHELYYPDGQVNFVTFLIDTSYILAYISAAVGIFIYQFIWDIGETFVLHAETMPEARFYAFAATGRENQLITVSENFYCLVNAAPETLFQLRRLDQVLLVEAGQFQDMIETIKAQKIISQEPLFIRTADNQPRKIWVSALNMSFSSEQFDGCNFALSADLAVPEELRLPRNNEISQMLRYVLSLAGSRPQDEIQAMKGYFLEVIHLLSTMVYQFGGIAFRSALFKELNDAALDKNVPVTIERQSIQFPDVQDGEDLARSLGPLLQTAVKFCADLIGPQIVKDELAGLENQLSETVRRDLDKFAFRAARALA